MRVQNSAKEVKKVEAVWTAMDKNRDGIVSKGEYGVALNSLNRRQIDFIFSKYDQDGDKNLSQEEFTKMMESWKKPKKKKKRRRKEPKPKTENMEDNKSGNKNINVKAVVR